MVSLSNHERNQLRTGVFQQACLERAEGLRANGQRPRTSETLQSHGIEEKTQAAVPRLLVPTRHGSGLCQGLEHCDTFG